MIKKFIESHPKKIIIGAPIIFLVIVNLTGSLISGNFFAFSTKHNFLVVGSEVPVTLTVAAKTPINAVGGTIMFSPESLSVLSTSRITSIIDLWAEEPAYSNTNGTLHFSGGILGTRANEFVQGTIIVVNFAVLKEGKTTIALEDGQILANDGKGTNVISGSKTLTVYARKPGMPTPDVNGDGILSVSDVDTLYWKTFRSYNAAYDLNRDSKVNWTDVSHLISLL